MRVWCVCVCASCSIDCVFRRKEFNGDWFNGKIISRSIEGLASDAKPRYSVKYEDEDEEELYVEEILPLLQVCSSLSSPRSPTHYTRAPPHTLHTANTIIIIGSRYAENSFTCDERVTVALS